MVNRPQVSVVIVSYNYGHLIEETLESVFAQSYPAERTEVIVVNDGSTDDTHERLEKYRGKIRYFHQTNSGVSSAMNLGIEQARGEILSFLDADDLWRADKLEKVMAAFAESHDMDVVYHALVMIDPDHRVLGYQPNPKLSLAFEEEPFRSYAAGRSSFSPPTSGISVRSSCLRRLTPIPQLPERIYRRNADLYLRWLLPLYSRRACFLVEPLGSYRIHGANLWGASNSALEKTEREIEILSEIKTQIARHAPVAQRNCGRIIRHLDSMISREQILADRLRLKIGSAFWRALRHDDYPPEGSALYRLFRKASLVFGAFVPHSAYASIRAFYQDTCIYRWIHRA